MILAMHKRYERDRKLVREKLEAAKAKGPLVCEVCAFDFEATYGELGAGYIEVHHVKPVHTLKPGSKVKLSDLALLCANCHRMAHRSGTPTTLDAIRLRVPLSKAAGSVDHIATKNYRTCNPKLQNAYT